jgi:hypothetical protein
MPRKVSLSDGREYSAVLVALGNAGETGRGWRLVWGNPDASGYTGMGIPEKIYRTRADAVADGERMFGERAITETQWEAGARAKNPVKRDPLFWYAARDNMTGHRFYWCATPSGRAPGYWVNSLDRATVYSKPAKKTSAASVTGDGSSYWVTWEPGIDSSVKLWGKKPGATRGKNPAKRPRLRTPKYVNRPSEATKKPPTKRLKERRAKNKGGGYFPNPVTGYVIYAQRGSGPRMHYKGEKFTTNGKPQLFSSQHDAAKAAQEILDNHSVMRTYRVTVEPYRPK